MVALCPGNSKIVIYNYDGNSFTENTVLSSHDSLVCALDWHPVTNQLVSCSHDRNAYVWTPEAFRPQGMEFKPNLCILNNDRAALCVKWSPNGKKFAVGTGNRQVVVCCYDDVENWWVPKTKRVHKSSVLSLAWNPDNLTLATCGTDGRVAVCSGYIKEVDGSANAPPRQPGTKRGKEKNVLDLLLTKGAWVNDVAWSPSGDILCFVGHDSSIFFVYYRHMDESGMPAFQKLTLSDLPFRQVLFVSERSVIAGGDDCTPFVFVYDGSQWVLKGKITTSKDAISAGGLGGTSSGNLASGSGGSSGSLASGSSSVAAAFARFQSSTKFGEEEQKKSAAGHASRAKVSSLVHKCPIECMTPVSFSGGLPTRISTSAVDGRLVVWDLEAIELGRAALQA